MKKIIIPISTLFVVGFSHAQNLSTDHNYVYTKNYLDYNGATASKTAETVQYLDGLGRPKQVVNIKASPLQKDVATHLTYDGFGRQALDYLPVPQGNTMNGAIVPNPLANAPNTPLGNEIIFAEKEFENSPLDRVLEQKQVGQDWSNKPVKFAYEASSDGDVKKYISTFNYSNFQPFISLSATGYGANQLYKNTVTDEDGNKTIEFKNGQGQTILVRKMLDDVSSADTYYVYNNYNQLAYVIPPLAVATNAVDETTLNNLCYQYKYDSRNRLVEKKLPGKGWEYMVYDKADRLVATQDANLRASSKWLITKYDRLGRIAYTGIMPLAGQSREGLQAITNNYVITEERGGGFARNGLRIYYTNELYNQIETVLSVNYYDTYPSDAPAIPAQILGRSILSQDAQNSNISTKSLPLATYVKNIEDDNWTKNYTWYDQKGRPIGTHSINHLGGYTKTESELDFSGTPKMVVTRHKRLNTDAERVITENFTYDHQNRLLTHTHQVDNNPVEYLVQNKYNELSQLESKKVGGTSSNIPLQQVDYAYNIRGWMTKINNPADLSSGDLFGYKIKYNQVEGQVTPNNDFTNLQVKPKYNGNIAEVDWRTNTTAGDNLRRYGYVYDGLNRLLAGFYQKDTNPTAKEYFEKMDYDLNGNITNLKRSEGILNGSGTAMTIDNLNYSYTGNRLNSVTDISSQYSGYPDTSGNTITYDLNGNMKNHIDKGILQIDYNYLNLPKYTLFEETFQARDREGTVNTFNVNANYFYRADGTKLRKRHNGKSSIVPPPKIGLPAFQIKRIYTDYLDGFQYEGITYGEVLSTPSYVLQFVPTSEGYFDYVKNKYIYNYADHLGNIRLSYFHNGSSIEVLEENNYYPFGLKHEGYNALAGNKSYQYKCNGKELQETGMYDYGARMYMPDIGRWGVVDPLAEKMRRHSPYNYAFNNPIRWIDPDGMSPFDVILSGGERQKAFTELQKSVQGQLNLSMDSGGKVTYTAVQGATINANSQQLVNAIDDHSINVNIKAENTFATMNNSYYEGGAFMGNTVTSNIDPASGKNIVEAQQEINPDVLDKLSTAYNNLGADTMHEVTEAYQGAKLSQNSGVSSPQGGQSGSVYPQAHSLATPQSGAITRTLFDAQGNILQPVGNTPTGFPNNTARIEVRANINNALILKVP